MEAMISRFDSNLNTAGNEISLAQVCVGVEQKIPLAKVKILHYQRV
jgi:hypothetical protein